MRSLRLLLRGVHVSRVPKLSASTFDGVKAAWLEALQGGYWDLTSPHPHDGGFSFLAKLMYDGWLKDNDDPDR